MPNLLDLIKDDSGLQELLANAGAMAKGAARGVTTDLVGAPVDLSNLLLGLMAGKGFDGLAKEPVGGSKSIRKATGQPAEDTAMEAVGNLLTAVLPSPGAAGHAIPMAIGAIRQGGAPTLNMSHTARVAQLTNALKKSPLLDSISIGIADRNIRPFAMGINNVSLLPNPASHQFDPATNAINQLINRDMYASRARDPRTLQVNRRYPYDYRMLEGENPGQLYAIHPDRLDTSQGYGNLTDYSQELAIAASPSFRSFKAYEKSDKGAKILTDGDVTFNSKQAAEGFRTIYNELFNSGKLGDAPTDIAMMVNVAANDPDPQRRAAATYALKAIQTIPSNYAELKMGGRFEVSPDTVTAILANPGMDSFHQDMYLKKLQEAVGPDIPVGVAKDLAPKDFTARYEDLATMMAESVKKKHTDGKMWSSSMNAVEAALKETSAFEPYSGSAVLQSSLSDYIHDPTVLPQVKDAITYTRQFESDVASFLNAIKLDAAK